MADCSYATDFEPGETMTPTPIPALEIMKKLSEGLKVPMFNLDQAVHHQRRNVEVFATASKVAAESVTALAAKQRDIFLATFADAQAMAKNISFPAHPPAVVHAQSEFAQRTMDMLITSSREMAAIIQASQTQMFGLLQQRAAEGAEVLRGKPIKSRDT